MIHTSFRLRHQCSEVIHQMPGPAYTGMQLTICICNVWLAVVFGINSASNAGKKVVIVRGVAEHYYTFHTCIASTVNSKYYSKPTANHIVTD